MNVVLWILQCALAVTFAGVGLLKLTRSRTELANAMEWVNDFSDTTVKTIGALELLAAVGLVLPALSGVATVLVPLAAVGLMLLMIAATVIHQRRGEQQMITGNIALLAMAAVVVWGRFGPYAF